LPRFLVDKGLTQEQIRNRSSFLDRNQDPHIPISTIRNWVVEEEAGSGAVAEA
jgi:hypothetical protein